MGDYPNQSGAGGTDGFLWHPDLPPVARFAAGPALVGAPTAFDASRSSDRSDWGLPLEYRWDFEGDGTFDTAWSTSPFANHTFAVPGSHTVTLQVREPTGNVGNATAVIIVIGDPPSAYPSADPTSGTAPLLVEFTAAATGGNVPLVVEWDFGDGNLSVQADPSHRFAEPGSYAVTLIVTDAVGRNASYTLTVVVGGPPVVVDATSDPSSGDAPLLVVFAAMASGGWGALSYAWDFGDGTTATRPTSSHTYDAPGTYLARVVVTDTVGATAIAQVTLLVDAPELVATFVGVTDLSAGPFSFTFTADATGGWGNFKYDWDFGDGNSGSGPSTHHTYGGPGNYTVTLEVTDGFGTTADATEVIVAVAPPITLQVSAAARSSGDPLNVTFTPAIEGGVAPLTMLVSFGDGEDSGWVDANASITHRYSHAGQYNYTVSVRDSTGQESETMTGAVQVEAPPPVDGGRDGEPKDETNLPGFGAAAGAFTLLALGAVGRRRLVKGR